MSQVMPDPTDQDLLARAAAGEPEAFGMLFERHARSIYNFCFRRTADWTAAEDLTSAVFLAAWRRRVEVRPSGDSLLPWLYGVAANQLRNHARSARRLRAALARVESPGSVADFADEVEQRLDDEARMRRILRFLGILPVHELDVLSLCSWQGLSYEEAAMALDVPVGTVRSRLSRARARLRELEAGSGHEVDEAPAVSHGKAGTQ